MTMWYRQGTASVMEGSTAVVGSLTAWTNQANPGDMITFDGGSKFYEIAEVTDNTHLVLADAFEEAHVSGVNYAIVRRTLDRALAADVAQRLADFLAGQTDVLSGYGAPADSLGSDGSIYFDILNKVFYGPKAGGVWPEGFNLQGDSFVPDAVGLYAERSSYDDEAPGFAFMATDGDPTASPPIETAVIFFKQPGSPAVWSAPVSFEGQQGEQGDPGEDGAPFNWLGDWSAGTYQPNDAVQHNGSSWTTTVETTDEPGVGSPNDWELVAAKGEQGDPGLGSGDVVGPAGATDERIAVFDGATGKLIKDGGTTIASLTSSILSTVRDGVDAAFDTLAEIAASLGTFVTKSLYDAHTILFATADNTPQALAVDEDRIVGRLHGENISALTPEQVTALLDAFEGASISPSAAGLKGLVPPPGAGDADKVLKGDGTWGDPAGGGGGQTATLLASGNLSGSAIDITDIPATFAHLLLKITGASSDTATRRTLIQLSTNNGSSFDATAGNYAGQTIAGGTAANNALATIGQMGIDISSAQASTFQAVLFGYQGGGFCQGVTSGVYIVGNVVYGSSFIAYVGSTSAINALRILLNGSGNFDAGTYALYGISQGS